MEKPKQTQNHEQKQETPEDYVVATFPVDIDPDNARRPLTVIRSGQDGEGVKYDRGWNPIGMSVVCDTDSEGGIGPIKLLMEAYKVVGTDIKTEFVPLEDIQGLNEDYIKYLCEKTPNEMIEEAKRIRQQEHPDSRKIESLAPGVGSDSGAESPSSSSVEDTSGHEKSLAAKVGPAMGGVAVKDVGIKKPIDTNRVETNEPVKKPVETGLDESDSRPELDRFKERVRELTKPLETDVDGMPFEDESVRVNYDHLYDPNYVPSNNVEDAAVRNLKGVPISENSFNAAKEAIDNLAMNPSLMQIINPEGALDSKAIINNIRASHLTRCRLFEYLTSSLDRLAVVHPDALSDRVLRDSEDNLKSPNYLGGNYYAGKRRSREYTVVLAIAMMDGSFDVDRQDKTVTHYRGGKERSGMHRDSARALLEYVRNNY